MLKLTNSLKQKMHVSPVTEISHSYPPLWYSYLVNWKFNKEFLNKKTAHKEATQTAVYIPIS